MCAFISTPWKNRGGIIRSLRFYFLDYCTSIILLIGTCFKEYVKKINKNQSLPFIDLEEEEK